MNDTNDIYEGMSEEDLTAQADALLAAADAAEDTTGAKKKSVKNSKKGEDAVEAAPEKKYAPLDEKLIASLPAAALLDGSEKLRDLFAKGRSKHRLESGELMEVLDEMELDGGQMDLIYDSLEQLNIEVNTPELIDNEDALDGEPPLEVIAEIEEEELVDPNELVDSFSIDDPVRMYLKEIGKVALLSADDEVALATTMSEGVAAQEKLNAAKADGTVLSEAESASLNAAVKAGR